MLMNHLAIDIQEWADSVFPHRTDQSMFLKMYKELGELAEASEDQDIEGEIADILILVLDYARRKGINPSVAVQRKMNINRQRTWKINHLGVMSHVKKPE